jgi:hypothetical protein
LLVSQVAGHEIQTLNVNAILLLLEADYPALLAAVFAGRNQNLVVAPDAE